MVVDALAGLKGDLTGKYYSLTQMTDKEQQQLIDVSHGTTSLLLHTRGVVQLLNQAVSKQKRLNEQTTI